MLKGRSGCCWSACLLPLAASVATPAAICYTCYMLMRYLYRASGTYRQANLDPDTTPDITEGRTKHWGSRNDPALVVSSISACLLLLAATATADLNYCARCRGLIQVANRCGATFGPVFSLNNSSSDRVLRSLFWVVQMKMTRGTRPQLEKAIPQTSPCQSIGT